MKALGNYRIDELLGEGGMGAVYRAYDLALHRDVAIKLIHEQYARRPIFRERFIQEARVMASLNHPGIVQVYHLGIEGDLLYIPMEFIPGGNLRQLLDDLIGKKQWLPLQEAIRLMEQLCQTLEYAHQHKVLHRDIKPANLMIKREPSKGLPFRLILTDLGLAKILEGQGLTNAGTTVGTPAYMSPEQASGQETDPRSDVYSLGILLYELAVGRLPFPIRSITEAVRYHTQEPPPPPRAIRPELPEAVERVILKALAKDPNQRYASAAGFGTILAGAMDVSIGDLDRTDREGLSLATVYDTSVMTASKPTPTVREPGSPPPRGGTVLDAPADPLRGGTILDGRSLPSRGGSLFEGRSISPSSQSRIQVVHKEHTAEVFPLPVGISVTIGRGSGNDIPLSDPKASQRHAQITWDGREYKVLDLNSTNGTFIGRNRLLPGMAEVWRADQHVRIGDTWLRLLVPAAEQPSASGFTSKFTSTSMYASSSAGVVAVAVNPQQLAMEAGGSMSITISLINQSPQVDHFSLSLTGVPGHWVLNLSPQVELMPGAPTETAFTLRIPRAPQSRAGRQQLTLKVASQRDPKQFAEVRLPLTIAPYSQFKAELQPQRLRAEQIGRLTITNQGNVQETFTVTFADDLQELDFQPAQLQVKVPEGQSASVEYRAQPRQMRLLGSEKSHPFQVKVGLPNAEPQTLRADLLSRAIFPAWVPVTLISLCLPILVVLYFLLQSVLPPATPTPTRSLAAILTPSATPDPRGPSVDEWCVYLSDQAPPSDFRNCPIQVKALPGQTLIIHWLVSNATEVVIEPLGNQLLSGDVRYEVTEQITTINLKASNTQASVQKATQIILAAPSVTATSTGTATLLPTLTPTPTSTPTGTPIAGTCDQAQFVSDVTIPAGAVLAPGTTFKKTWRLKNIGTCTWSGYQLVFDSGEAMSAVPDSIGTVAPGQEVDVSVTFTAPTVNNTYRSYWRVRNAAGSLIPVSSGNAGASFYVEIRVTAASTGFDFHSQAPSAIWIGSAGTLTFGGPDTDANGFAMFMNGRKLEDGSTDSKILETHPQWVDNGVITGRFPAYTVVAGEHFGSRIGFLALSDGSCGAGNARFQFNYREGGVLKPLGEWNESCDGTMKSVDVDLTPLAGKTVEFVLAVLANGSSTQDWAVWVAPRIAIP